MNETMVAPADVRVKEDRCILCEEHEPLECRDGVFVHPGRYGVLGERYEIVTPCDRMESVR